MNLDITLNVRIDNYVQPYEFHFDSVNSDSIDKIEWITNDNIKLVVITDENNNILAIDKDKDVIEEDEIIRNLFREAILQMKLNKQIENSDGFETTEDNESEILEEKNKDDIQPYDPNLIRVDTKQFAIEYVNAMISDDEIDLSPDFQREFVWIDITRKSRLIESLLLRIPIPAFYLSQDYKGKFQVVDGIQRLNVIHAYMNNEFKLKNLEYLTKECEGKWFNKPGIESSNLDKLYKRRIEQTQLSIYIIDPQTPEKVKYDIFKRINTGGKSLNNQEIRNCLSNKQTRELLESMATNEDFLNSTRHSISRTRMADKELVLRFAGFFMLNIGIHERNDYKNDMRDFLDDTITALNELNTKQLDVIYNAFAISMKNAYCLFGNNAFRKSAYINKALFLSWSRVLCEYTTEEISRISPQGIVAKTLEETVNGRSEYAFRISTSTNESASILYTYEKAIEILSKYL